jgi:hypothetical protein
MDDLSVLAPALQTVSSALVLMSMWFARTIHTRLREMETVQNEHRLELERKIADLRLETQVAIARMTKTK